VVDGIEGLRKKRTELVTAVRRSEQQREED